jgi:hypothetical protein
LNNRLKNDDSGSIIVGTTETVPFRALLYSRINRIQVTKTAATSQFREERKEEQSEALSLC